MIVGEVIETKTAFKPNQTDASGNTLPIGSILVRLRGRTSSVGQVNNVYARPAVWSRRIPLIGEQVSLILAPTNDNTTDGVANFGYVYFSPLNATDDIVLHSFHSLFKRSQGISLPPVGQVLHDMLESGYTFPKSPRATIPLQPFEGDDLYEGRLGQSIRFGSTVEGRMDIYDKNPTWKDGENTDPLIIMRVKKPSGKLNSIFGMIAGKFLSFSKYTIEDLGKDDSSIYMTSTQRLPKLKIGFSKNTDAKSAPNWTGPQIVLDADRVVINAKESVAMLIGKESAIVTGTKVMLQSNRYKVDLDELMDFLSEWLNQDYNLATGTAQYSTSCGPTAVSTNMQDYVVLKSQKFIKFKT